MYQLDMSVITVTMRGFNSCVLECLSKVGVCIETHSVKALIELEVFLEFAPIHCSGVGFVSLCIRTLKEIPFSIQ